MEKSPAKVCECPRGMLWMISNGCNDYFNRFLFFSYERNRVYFPDEPCTRFQRISYRLLINRFVPAKYRFSRPLYARAQENAAAGDHDELGNRKFAQRRPTRSRRRRETPLRLLSVPGGGVGLGFFFLFVRLCSRPEDRTTLYARYLIISKNT